MFAAVLELNSKVRYGMTSRGVPLFRAVPYSHKLSPVVAGCSERDLSKPLIGLFTVEDWSQPYQPGGSYPRAQLVRTLGRAGDTQAELQALLATYAGRTTGRLPPLISPHLPDSHRPLLLPPATFHIDPPGCRDVDDVVTVTPLNTPDHWEIAISIADVAEVIHPNTPAEIYAKELGATFYHPSGRVLLPMLHPDLSEQSLSLIPGQERNAVSLVYTWDKTTKTILSTRWELTRVCVSISYTYDEVDTLLLKGGPVHLHILSAFTEKATSHDMVEALMLRYNSATGTVLKGAGKGILRKQEPAEMEDLAALQCVGAPLFLAQRAAAYCAPFDSNTTHAALGIDAYAHASSPLRRYVDLINQRELKQILFGVDPGVASMILMDHVNMRALANKRFSRDAFFQHILSSGNTDPVCAICIRYSAESRKGKFYVNAWKRCVIVKDCDAVQFQNYMLYWYANQAQILWKTRMVFRLSSC